MFNRIYLHELFILKLDEIRFRNESSAVKCSIRPGFKLLSRINFSQERTNRCFINLYVAIFNLQNFSIKYCFCENGICAVLSGGRLLTYQELTVPRICRTPQTFVLRRTIFPRDGLRIYQDNRHQLLTQTNPQFARRAIEATGPTHT